MAMQPEYQAVSSPLGELCARATVDIEKRLSIEKEAQAAADQKREEEHEAEREEERLSAEREAEREAERLAAEQAEMVKLEKVRQLEEDRRSLAAAEQELILKRKLIRDAGRAVIDIGETDGADAGSDGSESATEQVGDILNGFVDNVLTRFVEKDEAGAGI